MTTSISNRRFGGLTAATVAAVALGALTVSTTPAKAQLYFGFGPGGFGVSVGVPAPYYYEPYYYPYRPYYRPYYHPW